MKHRKTGTGIIGFGLLGATLIATNLTVNAHSGASGIVKERMALMDRLGKAMKSLNAIFSNQAAYEVATVKEAAGVIEKHAGEAMIKTFPEGTNKKPSEALPIIWEDWDEFKSLANKLETYAAALGAAATNERGLMGDQSNMMTDSSSMMGGTSSMMGGGSSMMSVEPMMDGEKLKQMPPDAAFMQVTNSCSGCHTKFRLKKK